MSNAYFFKIQAFVTKNNISAKNVTTTVNNFLSKPKEFKKAPIPAQYGKEKENEAKISYKKLLEKNHQFVIRRNWTSCK